MKKLIVLSAIAALTSGAALASSTDFNANGTVDVFCNATNFSGNNLEFTSSELLSGVGTASVTFTLRCNDPDGARVELATSKGWLENSDDTSYGVGYNAILTVPTTSYTLNLPASGTGDANTEQVYEGTGSLALAGGIANSKIDVVLNGTGSPMAGSHQDTLLFGVVAN